MSRYHPDVAASRRGTSEGEWHEILEDSIVMWHTKWVFPLLIGILPVSSFTQVLPVNTYSLRDGLLSNDIESIGQDSRGCMWFGTSDGISVFDGKSFSSYTTQDGLPHNFVTQILPDRKAGGAMWIVAGGHLCKYAEGRFTPFVLDVGGVFGIFQDGTGVVWCGTDRGVLLINGSVVTRFSPTFLHDGISAITETGDSVLWFARSRSLIRYSRFTKEFCEIEIARNARETFRSMLPDRNGDLWVMYGSGGILQIRGTDIINQRPPDAGPISDHSGNIFRVGEEDLWTYGYDGLHRIPKSQFVRAPFTKYLTDNGLPENTIRSSYFDREGNLWIGGRDHGVSKVSSWNIIRFPLGSVWFVHHHQFATADSNSHLWVIAAETLMEFWRDRYGIWHSFQHTIARPDSLTVRDADKIRKFSSIFYDQKGRLWIATLKCPGPIQCYEIRSDTSQNRDGPSMLKLMKSVWVGTVLGGTDQWIYCFLVDRQEGLWVSIANRGIAYYTTRRSGALVRLFEEPGVVNYVRTLYEDRSGSIYAGTYNSGLFVMSADEVPNGTFRCITRSDGLPDNAVWDVREDRNGTRIVGTSSGGLALWERDSFYTLSIKNGLPSNKIFSTVEDSLGRLWLATSVGMIYENYPGSKIFMKRPPFVGSSALCCGTTRDRLIWFVTPNDLFIYDSEQEVRSTSPPVYITTLKVNGNEWAISNQLQLTHDQNNCEIKFIGISFKDENAIRYRYRLIGVDNEWHGPSITTSVTYGHLEPGKYQFEVTAVSIDGLASAVPASIGITITPPFWHTWWFNGSAAVMAGLCIWFLYRIRANKILNEQRANQEFSRQLIDSQEAERKRVARELHDDLGQNLLVIVNRAQMGLRANHPAEAKHHLNEIAETAGKAIEEVREIAFNLSPYHLEHLGLTESIRSMVEDVSALSPIQLGTVDNIDGVLPKEQEINAYRIIQECVNNVVKHASASQATVALYRSDGAIEIVVHDDGKGFDVAQVPAPMAGRVGLGITGLRERVKLLGGSLAIQSAPGKGTSVRVTIPYLRDGLAPMPRNERVTNG